MAEEFSADPERLEFFAEETLSGGDYCGSDLHASHSMDAADGPVAKATSSSG